MSCDTLLVLDGKVLRRGSKLLKSDDGCCFTGPPPPNDCGDCPAIEAAYCDRCGGCTPYCVLLTIAGHSTARHNTTWILFQKPVNICHWRRDYHTVGPPEHDDRYVIQKDAGVAYRVRIFEDGVQTDTYAWGSADDDCQSESSETIDGVTLTVTPCSCEIQCAPGCVCIDFLPFGECDTVFPGSATEYQAVQWATIETEEAVIEYLSGAWDAHSGSNAWRTTDVGYVVTDMSGNFLSSGSLGAAGYYATPELAEAAGAGWTTTLTGLPFPVILWIVGQDCDLWEDNVGSVRYQVCEVGP